MLIVTLSFLAVLFLSESNNLLLSLIILEIIAFLVLVIAGYSQLPGLATDYVLLMFFSVFVMEGVIALSGIISLVSTVGSDYVSATSLTNI